MFEQWKKEFNNVVTELHSKTEGLLHGLNKGGGPDKVDLGLQAQELRQHSTKLVALAKRLENLEKAESEAEDDDKVLNATAPKTVEKSFTAKSGTKATAEVAKQEAKAE